MHTATLLVITLLVALAAGRTYLSPSLICRLTSSLSAATKNVAVGGNTNVFTPSVVNASTDTLFLDASDADFE